MFVLKMIQIPVCEVDQCSTGCLYIMIGGELDKDFVLIMMGSCRVGDVLSINVC